MTKITYSPFDEPRESLPDTSYNKGLELGIYHRSNLDKVFPPKHITLKELQSKFIYFQRVIEAHEQQLLQCKKGYKRRCKFQEISEAIDSASWEFKSCIGVHQANEYSRKKYGQKLSYETTERMIHDLMNIGKTMTEAEELTLENALSILLGENKTTGNSGDVAVKPTKNGKPRNKRGRKPTSPELDKRIWDANVTGEYPFHKDLATAFGIAKKEIIKALNRERKRRKKASEK